MQDGTVSVIPGMIGRHFDEAAFIWQLRQYGSFAPDWSLGDLTRLDARLEAHLDGLRIAGTHGWDSGQQGMDGPGEVFVATLLALESRERGRIARVMKAGLNSPKTQVSVASAFGHVAPRYLEGLIKDLLISASPVGRQLGITACVSHGKNPGSLLSESIEDPHAELSDSAIRAIGELGLTDYGPLVSRLAAITHGNTHFWVARTLVLLGNRGTALESLTSMAVEPGENRAGALRLALQAMSTNAAHRMLQQLASDPSQLRSLIQGSGIAGDSIYAPWLIGQMTGDRTARLAGEAFSLITGVDLGQNHLKGKRPENFESGPNDDPDDPNVDMDPDDGLPWPDPGKVEKWWAANENRFQNGTRYFMGAPVTREHCLDVLKNGYQRQRILAAHYLCLLEPGTPLFNTSAPAWRQQRLLAKMT